MKSFNELYEEIYKENYHELEGKRKKSIYGFAFTIVITLIVSIILVTLVIPSNYSEIRIAFIIFIVIIIGIAKLAGGYTAKTDFKEKVTEKYIKNIDQELVYYPNHGIEAQKYNQGLFENYYRFYSKGYIGGKIEGKNQIEIAEVRTTKIYTDENGRQEETTKFYGLYECLECNKNIPTPIIIRTDRSDKGAISKFFSMGAEEKIMIKTDSTEFEGYFDVFSTNPILVMQILTTDVIQMLVDFRKESEIEFELTIRQNQIYVRFHTLRNF